MKFIKEPEGHDKNRIEFNSVSVTMPEILEDFKCFLMACGYPIDFSDEVIILAEGYETCKNEDKEELEDN
jgi:hypothetical protein